MSKLLHVLQMLLLLPHQI